MNLQPTSAEPRWRVLHRPRTVFIQPVVGRGQTIDFLISAKPRYGGGEAVLP